MEGGFWNLKADVKKLSLIIVGVGSLATVIMGLCSYSETKLEDGYRITRNAAGEGMLEEELLAKTKKYGTIPMEIQLEEVLLTEEEARYELEQAVSKLEECLKGNNESLRQVTQDLNFVKKVPQTPVTVDWQLDAWEFFCADGTLRTDLDIKEPVEVPVSAVLSCQEWNSLYETKITLVPVEKTIEQQLQAATKMALSENETERNACLPETFRGEKIQWSRRMDYTFLYIPVLAVTAVAALFAGRKRDMKMLAAKRKNALEKDYAELVSKFVMLLMAGMSVRNAWERIVKIYQDSKSVLGRKIVYEEMEVSLQQFRKGASDADVLEDFGQRTGVLHYKKLMSLFLINQKRGTANLIQKMETDLMEAWEERKRGVRRDGEVIGTKLMFPMMGMLAVVFVMILVPAFMSLYQK